MMMRLYNPITVWKHLSMGQNDYRGLQSLLCPLRWVFKLFYGRGDLMRTTQLLWLSQRHRGKKKKKGERTTAQTTHKIKTLARAIRWEPASQAASLAPPHTHWMRSCLVTRSLCDGRAVAENLLETFVVSILDWLPHPSPRQEYKTHNWTNNTK